MQNTRQIIGFLAIFLVLAALPASGQKRKSAAKPAAESASIQEDQREIENLHNTDIKAALAFDVDTLVTLWDDDIVSIPPGSAPIVGKKANFEHVQELKKRAADTEILAYEQKWAEVRVEGDYGYEYGTIHQVVRPPMAKAEQALDFNVMRILRKQPDGSWKIYRSIFNDAHPPQQSKPEAAPVQKQQPAPEKKLDD